jgi:hypothetical protein
MAGAPPVSAGLRGLPPPGLTAGHFVRRLLAEADISGATVVRGDGHALQPRHGRRASPGRRHRQPAAVQKSACRGFLFRRRPPDGSGPQIQRPHGPCALDGKVDAARRLGTSARCRGCGACAAALAALLLAALQPVGRARPRRRRAFGKVFRSLRSAARQGDQAAGRPCQGRTPQQCSWRFAGTVRGRNSRQRPPRALVDDVYTTGATVRRSRKR